MMSHVLSTGKRLLFIGNESCLSFSHTRTSRYSVTTIFLLLTRLNDAKEAFPAFHTDENLEHFMAANKINHPVKAIVMRLCEVLTRLLAF
jgi:hypothetical protein